MFEFEEYRGPTPHHSTIAGYQQAIPRGGERLMDLVESEAKHRHKMELRTINGSIAAHILGQVLGFILAAGIIGVGGFLVNEDHDIAGYTALLAGASGLVATVVNTVRKSSDE